MMKILEIPFFCIPLFYWKFISAKCIGEYAIFSMIVMNKKVQNIFDASKFWDHINFTHTIESCLDNNFS